MRRFLQSTFLMVLCGPASLFAQSAPAAPYSVEVSGKVAWTDTGIDVQRGQMLKITASGEIKYLGGERANPAGLPRNWRDLMRPLPVNSAGRGTLIGRIGLSNNARAFSVGESTEMPVRVGGRLYLGINGPPGDSAAEGVFHATIFALTRESGPRANRRSPSDGEIAPATVTAAGDDSPAAMAPARAGQTSPATSPETGNRTLSPNLFKQIPRRITAKDGTPGDMVNFLLIGSEEQVKAAFAAAGWVEVDRDVAAGVVQAIIATLSKRAYLTMPMSQLYLFGRPQDFGYAHAEPVTVVATRHHLRLWKSDLTEGGQPVWVGAATHDTGFERDQRNGDLTHSIDPNVDLERTFVGETLQGTGHVIQQYMATPPDPITQAETATGGHFFSSGEVMVLWLGD